MVILHMARPSSGLSVPATSPDLTADPDMNITCAEWPTPCGRTCSGRVAQDPWCTLGEMLRELEYSRTVVRFWRKRDFAPP